jgi:hypothetical protein
MSSFVTGIGRRGRPWGRGRALRAAVAYGVLVGGSSAVLAQSGDISGDAAFLVPAQACEDLRDLTDGTEGSTVGTEVQGDIIIVCDGGDATGRRSCEVLSGSTTPGASAGQGIGFCADRFPDGLQLVEGGETLKTEVVVEASSFGAITGTTDTVGSELVADIVCETFVDDGAGTRICRHLVEASLPPLPEVCSDDFIITPPSLAANADACDIIAEQLGNSVTEVDPTALAFALFIDVDSLGEPGSEALFACANRALQCFAAGTDEPDQVVVDYQISKIAVREDPDCVMIRGRRYC